MEMDYCRGAKLFRMDRTQNDKTIKRMVDEQTKIQREENRDTNVIDTQ
jgi:hypothetical protein